MSFIRSIACRESGDDGFHQRRTGQGTGGVFLPPGNLYQTVFRAVYRKDGIKNQTTLPDSEAPLMAPFCAPRAPNTPADMFIHRRCVTCGKPKNGPCSRLGARCTGPNIPSQLPPPKSGQLDRPVHCVQGPLSTPPKRVILTELST